MTTNSSQTLEIAHTGLTSAFMRMLSFDGLSLFVFYYMTLSNTWRLLLTFYGFKRFVSIVPDF